MKENTCFVFKMSEERINNITSEEGCNVLAQEVSAGSPQSKFEKTEKVCSSAEKEILLEMIWKDPSLLEITYVHDEESTKNTSGKKYIVLATVFVIVTLAIIGISVSTHFWQKETSIKKHGRYGIVFDAGGTGTRMFIYEHVNNKYYVKVATGCEKHGLSNYGRNTTGITTGLKKCLDKALTVVPDDVIDTTPVFMKATAGMRKMRLQNETEYLKVWKTVEEALKTAPFPIRYMDVITGKDEAKFSWAGVNELLLPESEKTRGLIELGSTSIQIAFEANPSDKIIQPEYQADITIHDKNYQFYANSYLCLGNSEFVRRFYARLTVKTVGDTDSNVTQNIDDPCSFVGDSKNQTKEYLWQTPCVVGKFAQQTLGESLTLKNSADYYTYVGTGNYTQCLQAVKEMFPKNCTQSNCGLNDIYQPKAYGEFMSIGGGAYYSAKYLKLPHEFTENTFVEKTKQLCGTNLTQIEQDKDFEYVRGYCLSNTYTSFLLGDVLKLNRTAPGIVEFVNKINGHKITWTLGSIITDEKEMSNTISIHKKGLESSSYYVIVVLSCILIITSLVILIYFMKVKNWSSPKKFSKNDNVI